VANFLLSKRIDLDRRTKSEGYVSKSPISCKLPLVNNILPGLPEFDAQSSQEERLASAIEANVRWSMHQLLETPEGQNGLKMGVKLVGAVYDITTGQVRFLA